MTVVVKICQRERGRTISGRKPQYPLFFKLCVSAVVKYVNAWHIRCDNCSPDNSWFSTFGSSASGTSFPLLSEQFVKNVKRTNDRRKDLNLMGFIYGFIKNISSLNILFDIFRRSDPKFLSECFTKIFWI